MRVTCHTFEEFLAELKQTDPAYILQGAVRYSIGKERPPDHKDPAEQPVKERVIFHASAVVTMPDDAGQYILEFAAHTGNDYYDSDPPELNGTEAAGRYKATLAGLPGITLRHGVIDY